MFLGSCAEDDAIYWAIHVSAKAPQLGTNANVELFFVVLRTLIDGDHRMGRIESNGILGYCRSSKLVILLS